MKIYKKIIVSILFGLLACVGSAPVMAQVVFGNKDCGEWIRSPTDTKRQWLVGYMSGLSAMYMLNGRKDMPLDKINSADQIFLWMDNYCKNNPLNKVHLGGIDLFLELMGK